jgi:hypothetical protein
MCLSGAVLGGETDRISLSRNLNASPLPSLVHAECPIGLHWRHRPAWPSADLHP